MALFVSQAALQNIPKSKLYGVAKNGAGKYTLKTLLFSKDENLRNIVKNPYKTIAVHPGDTRFNTVKAIQTGLSILSQIPGSDYSLPTGFKVDGDFKELTETAVKNFQILKESDPTGFVDALTISKLDYAISFSDGMYDIERSLYLGDRIGNETITYLDGGGTLYSYKLEFVNKNGEAQTIDISTNNVHTFQILGDIGSGKKLVKPVGYIEQLEDAAVDIPMGYYSGDEIYKFTPSNDHSWEITNVSVPMRVPNSKPYRIKAGDTLTSIIRDNYYPDHDIIIKGILDEPLFTIHRKDFRTDTRLRYYCLMLYFFNLGYDNGEQAVHFDLTNGERAFLYNELDKIFIHKNANPDSPSVSSKLLPNFYSFLKNINSKISAFNLTFTTIGTNVEQINIDIGKTIYLPPKEFVDILYYELNFNPDLFLQGDDYVDSFPSQLVENINTEINQRNSLGERFWDWLQNGSTSYTVAQEVYNFYQESLQFFKNSYQYLIETLTEYWPRGVGVSSSLDASLTFLVKGGISGTVFLWRKMSPSDKLILCMSQKGALDVGADTGVGFSAGIGIGGRKKKRKINLGAYAETGAHLTGGLTVEGFMEYEFPVEKKNHALISMLIAAVLPAHYSQLKLVGLHADNLLKCFDLVDIDPYQYLKKAGFSLSQSLEIHGQVGAMLGVRTKKEPGTSADLLDDPAIVEEKKSWFSLNELLSNLDLNFDFKVEGKFIDFSVEYEYGDNSFDPKTNTRRPVKVKTELGNSIQAHVRLDSEGLVAVISNLIGGALHDAAQGISFDRGVAMYFVGEVDATVPPPQGSKTPIEKKHLKIGAISGALDPKEAGDEFFLHIDLQLLKNMLTNASEFTIENAFGLLKSVQYRKRAEILGGSAKGTFSEKMGEVYFSKQIFSSKSLKQIMDEKDDKTVGAAIQFGAFYDVDITLKIADHPQYSYIINSVKNILTIGVLYIRFRNVNSEFNVENVRNWLYDNFFILITNPDISNLTEQGTLFFNNITQELIEKVQNTNDMNGVAVNLFEDYGTIDEDYIKTMISYIIQIPEDTFLDLGWTYSVLQKIFRFLMEALEISFGLDGYFDISAEAKASVSAVVKGAFRLGAGSGLYDNTLLVDKNEITLTGASSNDAMNKLYTGIKEITGEGYEELIKNLFEPSK